MNPSETRIYQDYMKVIDWIERRWEAIEPPCEPPIETDLDLDDDYNYKQKEGVTAPPS